VGVVGVFFARSARAAPWRNGLQARESALPHRQQKPLTATIQTESLDVVQSAANIQRVAVPLKGVP
jgi:hypothetical protein